MAEVANAVEWTRRHLIGLEDLSREEIELVLDGKVVAVTTADEARDDLARAGKGDGRHGFRFALYPPLPLAPGRVPALRVAGSDQVLPHLADSLDLSERLAVEGFVERISRTEASGWAWNPAAPDVPLQIELRFEGRRVALAAADAMVRDPNASKLAYVPKVPEVLHATRLVSPGESVTLKFKAPATPGEYPYVCTFPGHWRGMNGIMQVIK